MNLMKYVKQQKYLLVKETDILIFCYLFMIFKKIVIYQYKSKLKLHQNMWKWKKEGAEKNVVLT